MIKKYKISTTSDFGKCLKANSQINKNELIIDLKKNHIQLKGMNLQLKHALGILFTLRECF